MTEQTEQPENNALTQLGPTPISFGVLLLKFIGGTLGGAIGSLIFVFIFVIAGAIMTPFTDPSAGQGADFVSPVFVFVTLVMVFLASTVGNIISAFFLSLSEHDKYTKVSSTFYQIFIVSVIMFVLMVPVYFIAASINISATLFAAALHIILSAQVSQLILEVYANHKYSILGIYGVTLSTIVSAAVLFGVFGVIEKPAVFLFATLPVAWGMFGLVYSIVTLIYCWIVNIYDKDYLSIDTVYGNDYGKEVEVEPETIAPKAKDEAGADFLRHN